MKTGVWASEKVTKRHPALAIVTWLLERPLQIVLPADFYG
jgi:hypothetical protein